MKAVNEQVRTPLNDPWTPPAETEDTGWSDMKRTMLEVIRIILLRRWVFFVPFCLATAGALLASRQVPRKYKAATIFERREDVVTSNLLRDKTPFSFEVLKRSLQFDLTDGEAMAEVVCALGLGAAGREPAQSLSAEEAEKADRALGASLAQGIGVHFHQNSPQLDVIEINYSCGDPALAYRMANAVREVYIRRTIERINGILNDAQDFFEQHKQSTEQEIASLTDELLRFRLKYPGVDPGQPESVDRALTELERQRETLLERRQEAVNEIAARQSFLGECDEPAVAGAQEAVAGEVPGSLVPNPRRPELMARIRAYEEEIHRLQHARRMTDEHPEVRFRLEGIVELAAALEREPQFVPAESLGLPRGPQPRGADAENEAVRQMWEAQTARVEMEIAALEQRLERATADLAEVEAQSAALRGMRDSLFDRQREYDDLQSRKRRAQVQLAMWEEHLGVIRRSLQAKEHRRGLGFSTLVPAALNPVPISPRFATVLSLSLVMGLSLGVAVMVFCELLDKKYRTAGQVVRTLGLPVLETIEEIVTPVVRRRRLVLGTVLFPLIVLGLAGLVGGSAGWAYATIENPGLLARWSSGGASAAEASGTEELTGPPAPAPRGPTDWVRLPAGSVDE